MGRGPQAGEEEEEEEQGSAFWGRRDATEACHIGDVRQPQRLHTRVVATRLPFCLAPVRPRAPFSSNNSSNASATCLPRANNRHKVKTG